MENFKCRNIWEFLPQTSKNKSVSLCSIFSRYGIVNFVVMDGCNNPSTSTYISIVVLHSSILCTYIGWNPLGKNVKHISCRLTFIPFEHWAATTKRESNKMEMKGISFLDYRNLLVSSVKFELSSPKVDIVITLMWKKKNQYSLMIIILNRSLENALFGPPKMKSNRHSVWKMIAVKKNTNSRSVRIKGVRSLFKDLVW